MPSRGEPVILFSPIKLLKADIRTDHTGINMVLEFIDNNGTRLTTPSMPYPDNFDPMRIEHAECRGDEIRIKNDNGDVLVSVFADKIEYETPIVTNLDPNGYMCIAPEEGEDLLPIRRFSLDEAHPSEVGFARAFAQVNHARQELDEVVQMDLNARFPDEARPVIGASAWFREQAETFPYPNTQAHVEYETPKIKIDYDMKCTCCDGKIHYPDKLIRLLGNKGTIKYFEFCKKTKTEPQLFCCSCFGLMKNNSNIISAINKMNQKVKKMIDLSEREEEVTKREKELDEQLKKIKK